MPVSLFYHYTDIPDVQALASRFRKLGPDLRLAGRIRISTEGINGTFGGTASAVHNLHQEILHELGRPPIEFKVSAGSAANFPEGWKVRVCRELVTMGMAPDQAPWQNAAPHLSPAEFKREVLGALGNPAGDVVVLDVRNQYEHAIGHFRGAQLPPIRQFSDFPLFVRKNSGLFKGKRVLMYCTGGIRCERASSFLKGEGLAESVAQLRGGIDRFLNKYPCGGDVFQGKNLVFDTRMALGTTKATVVGKCVCCQRPWDDYSHNWRCLRCRARLLLCTDKECERSFTDLLRGLCSNCLAQERENVPSLQS